MKVSRKNLNAIYVLLFMIFACTLAANAQNCSSAVDKMCTAFNNMASQVNRTSSMEEFENLDFDAAISKSGVYDIDDTCAGYVLTPSDKTKLTKAFNGFVDSTSSKTYKFLDGLISKSEVDKQFAPMKTNFKKAIDSSRTLEQLLNKIDTVFG